jgi:hypothetical protein
MYVKQADFGPRLSNFAGGTLAALGALALPLGGCDHVEASSVAGKVALVVPSEALLDSGELCDFTSISINAQKAGAVGVLFMVDDYHLNDDGSGAAGEVGIPVFRLSPSSEHWDATLGHLFDEPAASAACRGQVTAAWYAYQTAAGNVDNCLSNVANPDSTALVSALRSCLEARADVRNGSVSLLFDFNATRAPWPMAEPRQQRVASCRARAAISGACMLRPHLAILRMRVP